MLKALWDSVLSTTEDNSKCSQFLVSPWWPVVFSDLYLIFNQVVAVTSKCKILNI